MPYMLAQYITLHPTSQYPGLYSRLLYPPWLAITIHQLSQQGIFCHIHPITLTSWLPKQIINTWLLWTSPAPTLESLPHGFLIGCSRLTFTSKDFYTTSATSWYSYLWSLSLPTLFLDHQRMIGFTTDPFYPESLKLAIEFRTIPEAHLHIYSHCHLPNYWCSWHRSALPIPSPSRTYRVTSINFSVNMVLITNPSLIPFSPCSVSLLLTLTSFYARSTRSR